ncbi:MAG: aldo/keto reductase [Clostridia bacterium]
MKKILLGKTGIEASAVIYGGIVSMKDGQENSDKYVEYAINKGINYFDVAPSYGDAEEKLGNSLIPYRKNIHIACKTKNRDAENAKRELEQSLNMLHTDYFDVYQMHELESVEAVERAFAKDGTFNVMLKAKEEGVAKNLGVTCHSEEAALRALELYDFDTVLFPTNWGLNLHRGFASTIGAKCKEKNVGFLGMKSLVHRAWLNSDEQSSSRFTKSWCKPISENDKLAVAAMKYAYQKIGANVLVPPGNIESFSFAVEHIDEILAPITNEELELLNAELIAIDGKYFF